jgi:hypothetical protein
VDSVKALVLAGAGNVFGSVDTGKTITVSVTAPSDNENFISGSEITLEAEASVTGGTIDSVQFFKNHELIGVSRSTPYSLNWENVPEGSYQITAKAIDNEGKSTFSDIVNITVERGVYADNIEIISMNLYPNPVTGDLIIQLNDRLFDEGYLTLFDSHGRSIVKETVRGREHRIDLSHIPEGIYIISITSKQGSAVRKFIKE